MWQGLALRGGICRINTVYDKKLKAKPPKIEGLFIVYLIFGAKKDLASLQ